MEQAIDKLDIEQVIFRHLDRISILTNNTNDGTKILPMLVFLNSVLRPVFDETYQKEIESIISEEGKQPEENKNIFMTRRLSAIMLLLQRRGIIFPLEKDAGEI